MSEVFNYPDVLWTNLINRARIGVSAGGIVLEGIDVEAAVEAAKRGVLVKLVLLDPEGQAVCQRALDEGSGRDNIFRIREKIRTIQMKRNSELGSTDQSKLSVRVRDNYPTIAVILVDHSLYSYFYPLGRMGTQNPIFQFLNYEDSDRAKFFSEQWTAWSSEADGAKSP